MVGYSQFINRHGTVGLNICNAFKITKFRGKFASRLVDIAYGCTGDVTGVEWEVEEELLKGGRWVDGLFWVEWISLARYYFSYVIFEELGE